MSNTITKFSLRTVGTVYLIGTMLIGLASCSKKVIYSAPPSLLNNYATTRSIEKQLAYQFVTNPKYDDKTLDSLLSVSFYSHDKDWEGDGIDFVKKRNSDLSFSQIKPVRILQDDSLVAVHSRMLGDTLQFRWDILRIEQHKIQEHWSNVYDSIGLNPAGHTEIDGPTIPSQLEKTEVNRALITRFIDQCMIREDGGASKFFDFGLYIQHNRDVGDGLSGLLWGMLKMGLKGEKIKFKYNYHVVAEGNLVLSATEGYIGDEKYVFYDLFRVEENKIVEHWDIIMPVNKFLYYQPEKK
ncbi:hypothetical protein LCGC14_0121710 [marine sediment metagenome]|uniref:SnoaL-like domain-containing protein n=1 Tax=marine sediment metagenome TaxID=412755 RepID=A0A0F9V9V6_9ZZZZ|nr:hypothetical protein [Maribacter sp.]HDZ05984.1 hypothetical protein [Maribacter sp.]HEA80730.1 hypothetical protein [Maribacter sp.]